MQISIWEQESFFAKRDVIIAGAGLTGLWCAYELIEQNPKLKILILESGVIPAGASTRNAGFTCFGSPTELLHDAKKFGAAQMWKLAEMRYKGIEKIQRIFKNDAIDYDNCGGYECLQKNQHDIEEVSEKLVWLNEGMKAITGEKETFVWANKKLQTFGFSGFDAMIENKLEGALHSGKLVQALTRKIQSLGVEILTNFHINYYEETAHHVAINTTQNISFCASKFIICSNAFSNKILPSLNIIPARGQIIVTTPISNFKLRGAYHFDEGFYYFRNIGNRLLIGGARNTSFAEENTTIFDTTDVIQQELKRFISAHILPNQLYEIEYKWSGIMGFTEDKLPLIKHVSDRIAAIIACNGMGVALSPVIAEGIFIKDVL